MVKHSSIYPDNFEQKIGFADVRQLLRARCSSSMGLEFVEAMSSSADYNTLQRWLDEVQEMRMLMQRDEYPSLQLADLRSALLRIRPDGTYLDEAQLLQLAEALWSVEKLRMAVSLGKMEQGQLSVASNLAGELDRRNMLVPHLFDLLVDAASYSKLHKEITNLFDRFGKIRDNASPQLANIRMELSQIERSMSRAMARILRQAQSDGWVDKEAQATVRDGRLVIPVIPAHKRKVAGIVHDESATGKTVFIEPSEIVEANNRLRELEADEKREIIKILTQICDLIRPEIDSIIGTYRLIGLFDFIEAKAKLADSLSAERPLIKDTQDMIWHTAKHPLLYIKLKSLNRELVPLDIELKAPEQRLIIISGPNAGGKSVCLKTVGLLQYMMQCGLLVTMQPDSTMGIFTEFFLDIGDEQSIEDDLSTYSSHLRNMKHVARHATASSLILIDEFGSGTEPQIGGAIAQALLRQFNDRGARGLITTHYQNLKTFAEASEGMANAAMLYDRHHMQPLFRLSIGRPGSSFAIEIARKIGLPDEVIEEASKLVGSDYVDMDKYLQDIVRDKRYWEQKRMNIRRQEKQVQELSEKYEQQLDELRRERKQLIGEAQEKAKSLLRESSATIERTIREIKEAQAERERTKKAREQLGRFRESVEQVDLLHNDEIEREAAKVLRRQERKKNRKGREKTPEAAAERNQSSSQPNNAKAVKALEKGDAVALPAYKATGQILELKAKHAIVAMGQMRIKVPIEELQAAKPSSKPAESGNNKPSQVAAQISDAAHQKRLEFKQEIDVRGMRAAEALQAIVYFIDDAVQIGIAQVRILHGTGTGALRSTIREYLSTAYGVRTYRDEHVDFGGAGITIVEME